MAGNEAKYASGIDDLETAGEFFEMARYLTFTYVDEHKFGPT